MERRHPQRQSLNQDRQQVGLRPGAPGAVTALGLGLGPTVTSPGSALTPVCQVRISPLNPLAAQPQPASVARASRSTPHWPYQKPHSVEQQVFTQNPAPAITR